MKEGKIRLMGRTVGIGIQDFSTIIENNCFYIDKTEFIKEWWENKDSVTLITRPRRFGKTLTMSMVETFFSKGCANRGELFENFDIWKEEKYRKLQGTYPVISLSFANIKEKTYEQTIWKICEVLIDLYNRNEFLVDSGILTKKEKDFFDSVDYGMKETTATIAVNKMCNFLNRYYHQKVIILLDEYDTPMQEAYVHGYWEELVAFTRSMFNSMFKTNPALERAIMTGITRVSKESIFSDLNNLKVVTTTSNEYADKFGFTEEEVFAGLDEMGFDEDKKALAKEWYDGFIFGNMSDIYNPWSVINYLDTGGTLATYWANSSSNSLVGKLIREGSAGVKTKFEELLKGQILETPIDEQIVYNQLDGSEEAIWSLLLASGYLKVLSYDNLALIDSLEKAKYRLSLTNKEVRVMFAGMVSKWFDDTDGNYGEFIKALLKDDTEAMEEYMNRVTASVFSNFDVSGREGQEPEKFYHGFVLGLLVDLSSEYIVRSNRESGFGRYDVMIIPRPDKDTDKKKHGIIIEFKSFNKRREKELGESLDAALKQIEERNYEEELISMGIGKERIYKYGFAFKGKEVLIGKVEKQIMNR